MAELYVLWGDMESARQYAAYALRFIKSQQERQPDRESQEKLLANFHAILGWRQVLLGEIGDAKTLAGRALDEDPDCYRAHNAFGLAYLREGDVFQAMRSFSRSMTIHPHQPEIERWLEEALRNTKGAERHDEEAS